MPDRSSSRDGTSQQLRRAHAARRGWRWAVAATPLARGTIARCRGLDTAGLLQGVIAWHKPGPPMRYAPLLLSLWVTACATGGTVMSDGTSKAAGAAGVAGSAAGAAGVAGSPAGAAGVAGSAAGAAGVAGSLAGAAGSAGGEAGKSGGAGVAGQSGSAGAPPAGSGGTGGGAGKGGAAGAGGKPPALPTICDDDLENGDILLECPEGSVIGGVVFAAYGTPGGSCGTFFTGACDAPNAKEVVIALCGGKTTCAFKASSAVFGDPCSGTMKNARVEVQCVACGFNLTQLCGPTCTNVRTDPVNCGKCGEACDLGTGCQVGACVCTPSECSQSCVMRAFDFGGCNGESCVCGNQSP